MDSSHHQQGNGRTDVEMSDIRLLDDDEDYNIPFGQSNLTSVLANPDFGKRRLTCKHNITLCILHLTYLQDDLWLQTSGQTPNLLSGASKSLV